MSYFNSRLLQIARSKYYKYHKTEEDIINMTKNIYVHQIYNLNEFEKM